MSIDKSWIHKSESGHNFILFDKNILYRRHVKESDFLSVKSELAKGFISDKFIGLPVSYMKRVQYRDDDNCIKIDYSTDSVDSFDIRNDLTRKDVFEYLKANTSYKESNIKKPIVLFRIKKPLIALAVLVGLFIYVYNITIGLNQGYEYEIIGSGRGVGIGGIVLAMAHLGMTKNILIFTFLAIIALYRIKVNWEDDSEIHYIIYKHSK